MFKDPLTGAISLSGYLADTRGFCETFVTCSATIPGLDVVFTGGSCALHHWNRLHDDRACVGCSQFVSILCAVHALFHWVFPDIPDCGGQRLLQLSAGHSEGRGLLRVERGFSIPVELLCFLLTD